MGSAKAILTTRDIEQAKDLVIEGWSIGYSMALLGFKSPQQEYLYRNSKAYRDLKEWAKDYKKRNKNVSSK